MLELWECQNQLWDVGKIIFDMAKGSQRVPKVSNTSFLRLNDRGKKGGGPFGRTLRCHDTLGGGPFGGILRCHDTLGGGPFGGHCFGHGII